MTVTGYVGDPRCGGGRVAARPHGDVRDAQAAVCRDQSPQGANDLVLSVALDPSETDDFARVHRQVEVGEPVPGQPLGLQNWVSERLVDRPLGRKHRLERAADDPVYDLLLRNVRRAERPLHYAVAEHTGAVADAQDLRNAVGDVDDCCAGVGQLAHVLEE